jgi:hypothetical protein
MSGKVMSGSWQLGSACPSVADSIQWSVPPEDEKFCEKQHQHRQWQAVFVDVWSLSNFHTFWWTFLNTYDCTPYLDSSL